MSENKFNKYLTYLMLDAAMCGNDKHEWWSKNLSLTDIELSDYVKITDESIFGKDYVTIEIAGHGAHCIRKRRK